AAVTDTICVPVATGRNRSTASAIPRQSAKLPCTVITASSRSLRRIIGPQDPRRRSIPAPSSTRKCGFALFHECPATLGVVIAGEALLDQLRTAREIALALVARGLVDHEFFRFHRARCVLGGRLG